ncbi:hypothetical protein K466DRAFT_160989 [Polyporus arcularius HHB13444]|uniref:Uncharacterized protein n=1 Tax=Polyporus arcularius HHB13444 TaxID=1314778 RepID=A0A5C3PTF7_9APHY|nr:hypothetical protein K466DRAFT_160989 [Polyporus arcularius HHB13444]
MTSRGPREAAALLLPLARGHNVVELNLGDAARSSGHRLPQVRGQPSRPPLRPPSEDLVSELYCRISSFRFYTTLSLWVTAPHMGGAPQNFRVCAVRRLYWHRTQTTGHSHLCLADELQYPRRPSEIPALSQITRCSIKLSK